MKLELYFGHLPHLQFPYTLWLPHIRELTNYALRNIHITCYYTSTVLQFYLLHLGNDFPSFTCQVPDLPFMCHHPFVTAFFTVANAVEVLRAMLTYKSVITS